MSLLRDAIETAAAERAAFTANEDQRRKAEDDAEAAKKIPALRALVESILPGYADEPEYGYDRLIGATATFSDDLLVYAKAGSLGLVAEWLCPEPMCEDGARYLPVRAFSDIVTFASRVSEHANSHKEKP